jgi:hypothetical protein
MESYWNYKSAVTSALIRGALFFAANVSAGWEAATGAFLAEFALDRYAATDVNFARVVDPHNGLRRAERANPTTRTSQGPPELAGYQGQGPWLVRGHPTSKVR